MAARGDAEVVVRDARGRLLPSQVLPREVAERNGRGEPRNHLFPNEVYKKVLFSQAARPARSPRSRSGRPPKAYGAMLRPT